MAPTSGRLPSARISCSDEHEGFSEVTLPFPILDVTDWPPARDEQLGTKPKQWLAHPDSGELWLWKASTSNVRKGGTPYLKGDDWSERIACEVGRLLGLPVADVELAAHAEKPGVVSRRFVGSGDGLVHGNELLAQDESCDDAGYTVGAVALVLAGVEPPTQHPSLLGAVDWFAGYLVLDALIGNTDRHIENWGVIRLDTGSTRLAPSFDHASSLGFLLSDDQRSECLHTSDKNRTIRAYASRSRTKFDGRPHPAEAAIALVKQLDARAQQHWIARVESSNTIEDLVLDVPESRMSVVAKEFVTRLYQENHSTLSQAFRTLSP